MNFEICKNCFCLEKNIIKYVSFDHSYNLVTIVGLLSKDADISKNCIKQCSFNVKDLKEIGVEKLFSFNFHEQKDIFKKIKEPPNTCSFYVEHFFHDIYDEEK